MSVQLETVQQREWPASVRHVCDARTFAADCVAAWRVDTPDDTVRLVTSELATNAVVHAGTPFRVAVALHQEGVLVEVTDGSDVQPVLHRGEHCDSGGRGLTLIDALSLRWGSNAVPAGKTVWALLPVDRRPSNHHTLGLQADR